MPTDYSVTRPLDERAADTMDRNAAMHEQQVALNDADLRFTRRARALDFAGYVEREAHAWTSGPRLTADELTRAMPDRAEQFLAWMEG